MDMAKPKIFVSFDFENDRNYKYTLNMWNAKGHADIFLDRYAYTPSII